MKCLERIGKSNNRVTTGNLYLVHRTRYINDDNGRVMKTCFGHIDGYWIEVDVSKRYYHQIRDTFKKVKTKKEIRHFKCLFGTGMFIKSKSYVVKDGTIIDDEGNIRPFRTDTLNSEHWEEVSFKEHLAINYRLNSRSEISKKNKVKYLQRIKRSTSKVTYNKIYKMCCGSIVGDNGDTIVIANLKTYYCEVSKLRYDMQQCELEKSKLSDTNNSNLVKDKESELEKKLRIYHNTAYNNCNENTMYLKRKVKSGVFVKNRVYLVKDGYIFDYRDNKRKFSLDSGHWEKSTFEEYVGQYNIGKAKLFAYDIGDKKLDDIDYAKVEQKALSVIDGSSRRHYMRTFGRRYQMTKYQYRGLQKFGDKKVSVPTTTAYKKSTAPKNFNDFMIKCISENETYVDKAKAITKTLTNNIEENKMKELKIEDVTLINDVVSSQYSTDELIKFIEEETLKVTGLKKLNIESKAITKLIEKHNENILLLISLMDKDS